MKILAHRGLWYDFHSESNKMVSFERAFEAGYGIETDLRDICGKIIISHDMPNGNEISFEDLLKAMDGKNLPLALNIKADGMAGKIEKLLKKYGQTNYFTFDMSIPELVYEVENTGLNVFSGCNDFIKKPPLYEKVNGVWLDSFHDIWYNLTEIEKFISDGKKVCVVSEDLHYRNNERQWELLKIFKYKDNNNLMLCTNQPVEADKFFR